MQAVRMAPAYGRTTDLARVSPAGRAVEVFNRENAGSASVPITRCR